MNIMKALRLITAMFRKTKVRPGDGGNFEELMWYFSESEKPVFFDVGANIGQSALEYKNKFPNSKVYCFEPFPSTFETLKINLKHLDEIQFHPFGFGKNEGIIRAPEINNSSMNTLVNRNWKNDQNQHVDVTIQTIDRFLLGTKINKVDYLKIDTEGYELDVLSGAKDALSNGIFSFIEVEVGMNKTNSFHVPFEDIKKELERFDYFIFKIQEQMHEWPTKRRMLRRCNLVFIHASIADIR